MLKVNNLIVSVADKKIIKGINFEIKPKELHVLMGPNGSGKSTTGAALIGHPGFKVSLKTLTLDGKNLKNLKPEGRAKTGIFLGFQQPITVFGVNYTNFLRLAYNNQHKELGPLEFYQLLKEKAKILEIPEEFLSRNLNDQFSGGEKKRMEMLQALVLDPKYAILDEPDTGTDVDTLKLIAKGIKALQELGTGVVLITHYRRILEYLKIHTVHILISGKIAATGGARLINQIEKNGYAGF